MDIKFILLMIGLFFFTLGYVNQNKYNCNINPSLNNVQSKQLRNMFYDKNILLDSDLNNEIYDYTLDDGNYSKQAVGVRSFQSKTKISDFDSPRESLYYSDDIQ
uniref:Uncharacterized protein n=1 Tax=viral metagenome TaxID=1070528 RepID=A0A6C0C7L5_9ZZZZ